MARNRCVMWVLPNGVQLGFRVNEKAPIVCLLCVKDPGKEPLEFNSEEEFARHVFREHKSTLYA